MPSEFVNGNCQDADSVFQRSHVNWLDARAKRDFARKTTYEAGHSRELFGTKLYGVNMRLLLPAADFSSLVTVRIASVNWESPSTPSAVTQA